MALQDAIQNMLDSTGTPGLSIALIRDGKIAWSKAFGFKDKDTKEKVSTNTIFMGASLGKPIFAYAVLKLSEQGKIALDTQPADSIRYASSYDREGKLVRNEVEDANVALTLRTTAEDYARFIIETMMKEQPANTSIEFPFTGKIYC